MASFSSRDQLLLQRLKLLHASLARSLPLEAAIEGVLHSPGPPTQRRFYARLLHGLRGGQSLAESLRQADPALPAMVLGLVAVGKRTGQLPVCTRYLLDYYQRVLELKQSLSRGFTYPLVVVLFIWISLGVFDKVIRGVFESLYKSAVVGLPASMGALFSFIHWLFLAPLLLFPFLVLIWFLARRAGRPLPGLFDIATRLSGKLVQRIELDRLLITLHIALANGTCHGSDGRTRARAWQAAFTSAS
jgi:type II secretory pathway component PulF